MTKDTRIAAWVKILALTHVCGNTIASIFWISCCFSENPICELSGIMSVSCDDNDTCAILECSSTVVTVDVAFIWMIVIIGGTVVAAIVACIGWSPERYRVTDDTKETAELLYDLYFGSGCILHDYSYEIKRVRVRLRRSRKLKKYRRT